MRRGTRGTTWIRSPVLSTPMTIHGDNQGSLSLAENPQYHQKTKHIEVQYHYIRQEVKAGNVVLNYLPTERMPADGLTKPLNSIRYSEFLKLLNMQQWIGKDNWFVWYLEWSTQSRADGQVSIWVPVLRGVSGVQPLAHYTWREHPVFKPPWCTLLSNLTQSTYFQPSWYLPFPCNLQHMINRRAMSLAVTVL